MMDCERYIEVEMGDRPCSGKWLTHRHSCDTGECLDCGKMAPIRVNWNHIDGPMMTRPNGTLKWLTVRERLMHWLGFWTLEDISRRPFL